MVQVHVPKRTLEGVFLALLAPVAPHQLLQRQVVARHQDHRVPRDQKPLAVLRPATNYHVVLLPVPPARAVRREDPLLGKRAKKRFRLLTEDSGYLAIEKSFRDRRPVT